MIKPRQIYHSQHASRCQLALQTLLVVVLLFSQCVSANSHRQPEGTAPLQQAIDNLAARSGPPGAHQSMSELTPLSLIPKSIWQRLRNNFEFNELEHPRIDNQLAFLQKGLLSLNRNLQRATPFLYFIVDEIDRNGLPLDIALLPLIESAFDPLAKSHQSAAGLWQFIPGTADDFGLNRNTWYDGRYDVVASTNAAIRYLSHLNKTFDGDWLLTLAAYNTGPGNVRNAMQRARNAGLEPAFWNLRLAKETREYVPRIIAATKMIANPQNYQLVLPELKNRKQINTIAVGRPMKLQTAAWLANIPEQTLLDLNPGYLRGEIPLGGPYHLTIPVKVTGLLLTELNKRKLNSGDTTDKTQLTRPLAHDRPDISSSVTASQKFEGYEFKPYKKYVYQSRIVQAGDNFWDMSREMNTDVDTLIEWNGKSAKLQPGDKMIVAYIDKEKVEDVNQKLINYRVSPKDTLFTITDKFSISISKLKKWNPALWHKNHLRPGQALKIPIQTSNGF